VNCRNLLPSTSHPSLDLFRTIFFHPVGPPLIAALSPLKDSRPLIACPPLSIFLLEYLYGFGRVIGFLSAPCFFSFSVRSEVLTQVNFPNFLPWTAPFGESRNSVEKSFAFLREGGQPLFLGLGIFPLRGHRRDCKNLFPCPLFEPLQHRQKLIILLSLRPCPFDFLIGLPSRLDGKVFDSASLM